MPNPFTFRLRFLKSTKITISVNFEMFLRFIVPRDLCETMRKGWWGQIFPSKSTFLAKFANLVEKTCQIPLLFGSDLWNRPKSRFQSIVKCFWDSSFLRTFVRRCANADVVVQFFHPTLNNRRCFWIWLKKHAKSVYFTVQISEFDSIHDF